MNGYICETCRLIWVGGHTPGELGEELSPGAEAFAEQIKKFEVAEERDTGHGYCDCLICEEIIIDGYPTTLEMADG